MFLRAKTPDKYCRIHAQRFGQAHDVLQADVSLAPLYRTHIGPMQSGLVSETLLRPMEGNTTTPYASPKLLFGARSGRLRHALRIEPY